MSIKALTRSIFSSGFCTGVKDAAKLLFNQRVEDNASVLDRCYGCHEVADIEQMSLCTKCKEFTCDKPACAGYCECQYRELLHEKHFSEYTES